MGGEEAIEGWGFGDLRLGFSLAVNLGMNGRLKGVENFANEFVWLETDLGIQRGLILFSLCGSGLRFLIVTRLVQLLLRFVGWPGPLV